MRDRKRLVESSPRVAYVRGTETPERSHQCCAAQEIGWRIGLGLGRNIFHGREGRPWKSVERRANANLAHVGAFPYSFAYFWTVVLKSTDRLSFEYLQPLHGPCRISLPHE
jgi:hypothetical protein